MENEFYTVKELAEKFRVTERTIRKLLEDRELPYYQIGRQKRIAKNDIENHLKEQSRKDKMQKA